MSVSGSAGDCLRSAFRTRQDSLLAVVTSQPMSAAGVWIVSRWVRRLSHTVWTTSSESESLSPVARATCHSIGVNSVTSPLIASVRPARASSTRPAMREPCSSLASATCSAPSPAIVIPEGEAAGGPPPRAGGRPWRPGRPAAARNRGRVPGAARSSPAPGTRPEPGPRRTCRTTRRSRR